MKTGQGFFRAPIILGSITALIILSRCLSSGFDLDTGRVAGVYEGTGRGCRGPIVVRVQISPGGIEDIVIISHRETPSHGVNAMEELLEMVLETGSVDLDVISGATLSSRGFLDAVENALSKAR